MPKRDSALLLEDMLSAIRKIERYMTGLEREGFLPKALDDALHIAVSAVHGIDYLLTWNCRHLDNAEMKPIIRRICGAKRHPCPEICTPQELMGVASDD